MAEHGIEDESSLANYMDLATKILEVQVEDKMDRLQMSHFDTTDRKAGILYEHDKQLVSSIVNSGMTRLTYLHLESNAIWFADIEASEHLCGFIS